MSSNKETIASLNRRYGGQDARSKLHEEAAKRRINRLRGPLWRYPLFTLAVSLWVVIGIRQFVDIALPLQFGVALVIWAVLIAVFLAYVKGELGEARRSLGLVEEALDSMDRIGQKIEDRPAAIATAEAEMKGVWASTNKNSGCYRGNGKPKVRYQSKKNAEREADRLNRVYEIKFHEYLCSNPKCGHWHVGRAMWDRDVSTS